MRLPCKNGNPCRAGNLGVPGPHLHSLPAYSNRFHVSVSQSSVSPNSFFLYINIYIYVCFFNMFFMCFMCFLINAYIYICIDISYLFIIYLLFVIFYVLRIYIVFIVFDYVFNVYFKYAYIYIYIFF